MKKIILYPFATLLLLFSAVGTISAQSGSEESESESSYTEGKVVFELKTDFVSLAQFLHITEKEFHQLRKEKSMLEIAQMQGISKEELFNYLVAQHYKALETAYNKKQVDLHFVMDYVLHLKKDIEWEMSIKK